MTVIFNESLHHVCLMYGLKQTFGKMPFLNRKVLDIMGKVRVIDNVVAPPPMMKNPERLSKVRKMRNIVEVSYWKDRLSVEYNEDMCSSEDITAFMETLVLDYLHLRHPYMKTIIEDGCVLEVTSRHKIAEVISA